MSSYKKKTFKKKADKQPSEQYVPVSSDKVSVPLYTEEEVIAAKELYFKETTACANDKDVHSVGLILQQICPGNLRPLFNLVSISPNKNWTTRRLRPDARLAFFGKNAAAAQLNDSGSSLSIEDILKDTSGEIKLETRQLLAASKLVADEKLIELREANRRYLEAQKATIEARNSKLLK